MSKLLAACKSAGSLRPKLTLGSPRTSIPVVLAPNSFSPYTNMSSTEPRISTEFASLDTDSIPEVAPDPSEQDQPATGEDSENDIPQEIADPQPDTKQAEAEQTGTESSRKEDEGKAQVGHILTSHTGRYSR